MLPLVSVILPVYNQEKYIAETIESVLSQTFTDFEFLILDDGSTDNSAGIIRAYAAKDERIIAFYEQNAGKCIATNNLVNKAKGKWCSFLDADDVMLPKRLEKQVAFHLNNPNVDASSCHCYYINEKSSLLGKQYYPGLESIEECRKVCANNEVINCAFTGLMVSKNVYLEIGGLRSVFTPCEDFDFVNRIIEQGYILLIIQEILMKYRIHSSAVTVRKPLHMMDKMGWIYHCTALRRSQKSEITFEEYIKLRQKDSWWVKLDKKRFNYSMIFFRSAGFSLMSKKYIPFMRQILAASLLSPNYVLLKFKRLTKRLS